MKRERDRGAVEREREECVKIGMNERQKDDKNSKITIHDETNRLI